MTKNASLLYLLICGMSMCGVPHSVMADDKVDAANMGLQFSGELINTSCTVTFPRDTLIMEAVGIDKFTQPGMTSAYKKNFQLIINNCNLSPAVVSDIRLSFSTLDGQGRVAPGAFSNQLSDGAKGIGFAVYDQRDNQNVLTVAGESRVLNYPVNSSAPLDMPRDFYVKYIQSGADVTAGQVSATLLVSAFYD